MKFFKWKIFLITAVVCLLPILLGVSLWSRLPDAMAIHFNVYGEADNFASKGFVVFVLPVLMVVLQGFCCFINDINAEKNGERKKLERVTKWIIPVMTMILQVVTLGYGLGWNLDIRRIVTFIVGSIFLVIGNYMPKFDYIKNFDVDTEKVRKINRFIGYETICMGLVFFISLFLPPISTVICLILLIPYSIVGAVYGIITARKQ
ncbi:MAG: DUF1648 domain-containing protein [Ruminococcaceae bacterium]|nr:DUF1648 domain-containing protein [Oscillospiraceae bacterium]